MMHRTKNPWKRTIGMFLVAFGVALPLIGSAIESTNGSSTLAETNVLRLSKRPASTNEGTNLPPTSHNDFAYFKILTERNIFDPNRSGKRASSRSASEKPVRADSFSLVGTLSSSKGSFAFFDGPSSQFRKALKKGETMAGYKVALILPNAVQLEKDGKEIDFPVGAQMKKQEDGAWEFVPSRLNVASAVTSETSTPASSSDGDNDILKRLLQKREEELNK